MSVKFPVITNLQFALLFCEADTGIVLYKDLQRYIGQGDYYYVFDSLNEAESFALEITNKNPSIFSAIFNNANLGVINTSDDIDIPQVKETKKRKKWWPFK